MTKKAYIAGKVTGLPATQAKNKFKQFENKLIKQGYEVVNPITHIVTTSQHRIIKDWSDEMKVCIPAMLHCDELHLMPCWQESRGAVLERDIALRLGMQVVYH